MERTLFGEEHRIFRDAFSKFLQTEAVPNYDRWESQGKVDREFWTLAGRNGFLCPWASEKYGGSEADFLYSVIMAEEVARHRVIGFMLELHNDIVGPYIDRISNDEQKERWMPRIINGDAVLAIAMTEPGIGSNLAGVRTTAVLDGDEWVLNGQKTFISNGQICDLVVVVARTDPNAEPAHRGLSLFVVEGDAPGFRRGLNLKKMGRKASDTSELFFEDCRIPAGNLLGEAGKGFYYLMDNLQQERLVIAVASQVEAEWTLGETLAYVKEREVFGKPLSTYQNTQFKLAECATQIELGRVFIDRLIADHMAGKNLSKEISMAKWWITDMNFRVVHECLQLFGGYGYMEEYPICRAFRDFRVESIFAGSNEIMKHIIAKQMGLSS